MTALWPSDLTRRQALWGLAGTLASSPAWAQFFQIPDPGELDGPPSSAAGTPELYRLDLARHIYRRYQGRIFRGRLPPLLYAVMMTEVRIGAEGQLLDLHVVRPPAAAQEVVPWVLALIRRAAPFPVPAHSHLAPYAWREVWLVDRSGRFQVQALSEGQR